MEGLGVINVQGEASQTENQWVKLHRAERGAECRREGSWQKSLANVLLAHSSLCGHGQSTSHYLVLDSFCTIKDMTLP